MCYTRKAGVISYQSNPSEPRILVEDRFQSLNSDLKTYNSSPALINLCPMVIWLMDSISI